MPREVFGADYPFLNRKEILTYEEITRAVRVFVGLGVQKVRVTGGEPLLRRDLPQLISRLAAIEGIEDLTLTTNGLLLREQALPLKRAGLHRVTVSLDSLDQKQFERIAEVASPVQDVLAGIERAVEVGLAPVKVNAVIRRGINENAILELASFFRGSGSILRFVEFMDVGSTNGWRASEVVSSQETLETISAQYPLEPVTPNYPGEVARRWKYRDGQGEIGLISSVSSPFCRDCTRARLSPEGYLYTCLFATAGHDLRPLLRSGKSDAELAAFISRIWKKREDRYSELRGNAPAAEPRVEMSHIGG